MLTQLLKLNYWSRGFDIIKLEEYFIYENEIVKCYIYIYIEVKEMKVENKRQVN